MKRSIIRITTAAAAVSAAALFIPATATAAPVSANNCAQLSTAANPAGWGNTFGDEPKQAGTHVADKLVDADGSLKLTTVPGDRTTPRAASYAPAGQLALKALKGPLTYENSGVQGNWQIRITGADVPNSANGFATLRWSGKSTDDATKADDWLSSRTLGSIPANTPSKLADLQAAAGDKAVIDHYGISIQTNEVGDSALIDNVVFNGCKTNFALNAPSGSSSGSLGNFGIANLISGRS